LAWTQLSALNADTNTFKVYRSWAYDNARKEPITPWLGTDTAKHYQWYPFINIGHYELAREKKG
jgi:endoglucanase